MWKIINILLGGFSVIKTHNYTQKYKWSITRTREVSPCNPSQYLPSNYCFTFYHDAAAAAKLIQSCPTLWGPRDGSPPGSPVPGIIQARTLEWVAISFSNAWKWKVKVKSLSHVQLVATPWTAAYQSPLSVGFSKQEYWSGLPLPSPDALLRLVHNPDVIGILSSS